MPLPHRPPIFAYIYPNGTYVRLPPIKLRKPEVDTRDLSSLQCRSQLLDLDVTPCFGGHYLVRAHDGQAMTSPDGHNWTLRNP